MTQEQYDVILAKLNAIAKAVAPKVIDNPLVGTGETKPAAPSVPEVAADPGKYDGTDWDPINRTKRIDNSATIANFETMSFAGEFVGGTLADWARKDRVAMMRYVESQWPGFRWDNLSPSQREFLSLFSN